VIMGIKKLTDAAVKLEKAFKEAQALEKVAKEKKPALPLDLTRAKPKTKQEITDIADRVARQQSGEFIRKSELSGNPKHTQNLAGRSGKEVKRLQDLDYTLERTKDIRPTPTYESEVGDINIAIPGDQTIADFRLVDVNGRPIDSVQQGGSLYGEGKLDLEDPLFWASEEGIAQILQDKITELAKLYNTDRVTAYHLAMGQDANNFAMHFADANLKAIANSDLSPEAIEIFNQAVREGPKHPKTGKKIPMPHFAGIENPQEAYMQMLENPMLRKWFNNRMKVDKYTTDVGLPNGKDIQWAITEPALRNMEINLTGHSAGRMKPFAELTDTADHVTYGKGIQGESLGRAPELAPFEMSFPDADLYLRSVYAPSDLTGTMQKVFPHQVVDQQQLDQMSEYYRRLREIRGFKKGGEIDLEDEFRKADMIAPQHFDEGGKAKKKKSKGYGERIDGTEKERGFLGEIRLPDGRDVMTEVSVGMPNTDELFRPSIIRGMHPADLNYLRETGIVPEDLYQASLLHAQKRIKEGKSPFWNAKEDAEPQHFGLGGIAKVIKKGISALDENNTSKAVGKELNRIAGSDVSTSKNLTTVEDYHTSIMDEVKRRAQETKKQMDSFDYLYSPNDYVFTEWTSKNNKPPHKILDKAMTNVKMLGKDSEGNKIYAPRKPGYWIESTDPEGNVMKYIIPEDAIIGKVEPEKYGVGGIAKGASKIKNVAKKVLESKGKYGAERVEKAADLVPNLEKQYDEHALYRAFIGDGDNAAGLMVMNPRSFESYSAPLWDEYVEPQYIHELAKIARQKGFEDVPYLMLGRKESEYLPRELQELYIAGHEGRHRTRALDKLGDESTLIRMIPRSSMREHLPRRSQEEYIDALNKELGLYPLVRPEQDTEEVRSLVRLPKVFAKGGSANLEEEFRKADMFADGGWSSKYTKKPKMPEYDLLPSAKTVKKVGKAIGKMAKEEYGEETAKPTLRAIPDTVLNIGADIIGAPADIANIVTKRTPIQSKARPFGIYEQLKQAPQEGEPMFGSENIRKKLRETGLVERERPLIETALETVLPFGNKLKGLPVGMSIEDVTPKAVNFVSSVERAIKGHKMESMNGEQWANWMRANASKSAKKEAEATGLYDWLKSQGKVSKADIEAYVEGNLPQITKIEKGAPLKLTSKDEIRLSELHRRNTFKDQEPLSYDEYNELMRLENIRDKTTPEDLMRQSQMFEESARKAQAKGDKEAADSLFKRSEHMAQRAEALELNPLEVGGSRFEKWKEPGGERYREVTLSIPSKPMSFKEYVDYNMPGARDPEKYRADYEAYLKSPDKTSFRENYRVPSAHGYGDPEADINRLLHYRANERFTPEGKKAMFLEELQSDWAQKARKTGIKQDVTDDVVREYYETHGKRGDNSLPWEELPSKDKAFLRHIIENRQVDAVPNAPYITDTGEWTKLGLRHALKDAIEGGHDYLAWTTGEQQAKRYDLSKQVSEIAYHPKGKALEVFDLEGNNIINEEGINPEDLSDYIGKEAAEKVLNSTEIDRGYNILKGDNIRVGGEGMKAYYDRIIPQSMNDILKQYGIKDGVKPIDVDLFPAQRASQYDSPETTGYAPGDIIRPARYSTQMGIEITPELREKILSEGLPHFKAGGSVDVVPFPRDN
jgi:hypothetical protein